jgi:hypothetical protein
MQFFTHFWLFLIYSNFIVQYKLFPDGYAIIWIIFRSNTQSQKTKNINVRVPSRPQNINESISHIGKLLEGSSWQVGLGNPYRKCSLFRPISRGKLHLRYKQKLLNFQSISSVHNSPGILFYDLGRYLHFTPRRHHLQFDKKLMEQKNAFLLHSFQFDRFPLDDDI